MRRLAGENNFSPNCVARGLRLKRTATIGVVIPDISNPFFAGIVRQVTLGAQDCRYSVIICDSRENEDLETESLTLLSSRNVEGIVLCPVGRSAAHLTPYENSGLPIVLADRYFPGLQLPYVASDNVGGARAATTHLIENGHRRIACLLGSRDTSPNEDRLRGYCEAMTAHQLPIDESLIAGDGFSEQNGLRHHETAAEGGRGFHRDFRLQQSKLAGSRSRDDRRGHQNSRRYLPRFVRRSALLGLFGRADDRRRAVVLRDGRDRRSNAVRSYPLARPCDSRRRLAPDESRGAKFRA